MTSRARSSPPTRPRHANSPLQTEHSASRSNKVPDPQALEPGDSLVDRAVQMYDQDRMSHFEWAVCVSREHELTSNSRKDTGLTFDAHGALRLTKQEVAPCDASSELLIRNRCCLMRSGLHWTKREWVRSPREIKKLFQARLQAPPPGYAKVFLAQLEQTDKKLFLLLGEETPGPASRLQPPV